MNLRQSEEEMVDASKFSINGGDEEDGEEMREEKEKEKADEGSGENDCGDTESEAKINKSDKDELETVVLISEKGRSQEDSIPEQGNEE